MKRKASLAMLLSVFLLLASNKVVLADYTTSDGYVVHWAGDANIVVTDSAGNTVYQGTGTTATTDTGATRLVWDGSQNVNTATPQQLTTVTTQYVLSQPDTTIAVGATSGGSSDLSTGSTSPYAGMNYATMVPVTVQGSTGTSSLVYANAYTDPTTGLGHTAVTATSTVGQQLAAAGFEVVNGMVLLNTAPVGSNVTVAWDPSNQSSSMSLNNVSAAQTTWAGGGSIVITLPPPPPTPGTPAPPPTTIIIPTTTSYQVMPDLRWLRGFTDVPLVNVARLLPLSAQVSGTASAVTAVGMWGGIATLERDTSNPTLWHGQILIPDNASPGLYQVTFSATISQPPYADAVFQATAMVRIAPPNEIVLTPSSPGFDYDAFNDWWTPPQYQGR